MLRIEDVDFAYPDQQIFNKLNIHIAKGDFTFLLGKSGIGKSTLFQLIYMNIKPQGGLIEVGNYDSATIQPKELPELRKKLGVVFQDFRLLNDRNIYDNLAFILQVTGHTPRTIKRRVMQVLNDVGLAHKLKNRPNELSGGEKQRIAIARAIINDPILLLADEPTGNLDPETSSDIIDIITKIHNRGTTVLIATHNYELVKKKDSRILRLTRGQAQEIIL